MATNFFKVRNKTQGNQRIAIISNGGIITSHEGNNPTQYFDDNETLTVCLSPWQISCVGADNSSGCIDLYGLVDLYIDDELVVEGGSAEDLITYQGDVKIERCQPIINLISCDGATNIITFETSKARTGIFYAPLYTI